MSIDVVVRGRARARESEHGAVMQREVARMLGQPLLGEVDGGQQLAATLGVAHGLEPL